MISNLEADEVPGVTYCELDVWYCDALVETYPWLSEEQVEYSGQLFDRIWSNLVKKQVLNDHGDGYFRLSANSLLSLD